MSGTVLGAVGGQRIVDLYILGISTSRTCED